MRISSERYDAHRLIIKASLHVSIVLLTTPNIRSYNSSLHLLSLFQVTAEIVMSWYLVPMA